MQSALLSLGKVLRLLVAFVVTAAVAGALAAGLAIPAVGLSGAVTNAGVTAFEEMDGELFRSTLAQQSRILDASGRVIATPTAQNRTIVALKDVAPIMQKAQIAIEDSRFYEHGGLDVRGLSRAVVSNLTNDTVQGASTITQQFVKLTLQENALQEGDKEAARAAVAKTLTRKLQELKIAVELEKTMTKSEILEGYLNIAYYGDLAYGVEAAAQHYFSVPASKLNIGQAALLAGLTQQPGTTDPVNYPDRAQNRRDIVLNRMRDLGIITEKQATDAKAVAVKDMLKVKPSLNTCQRSPEPYFCNYVIAWLKTQPALGKTVEERTKKLTSGGLTIRTTLNPEWNSKIRDILAKKVPVADKSRVGAAATVIEPGTGKVLAMAQTSKFGKGDWGTTEVNWNVDQQFGGGIGFSIGSTAKMFAIVRALETGMAVDSSIMAAKYESRKGALFTDSMVHDECHFTGEWWVRNSDGFKGGKVDFRKAVADSINTAFAPLVLRLGACSVQETMTKMGLHRGDGSPFQRMPSPVTLGSDNATPLTLANSYATVAAGGKMCQPLPVVSIIDAAGKEIKLPGPQCEQVIDPGVAAGTTELLEGVLKKGGTGSRLALSGGRQAAGKTGTTDRAVESYFVGYTPQYATAVYVGSPNTANEMIKIRIGGEYYRIVYGATIAGPLWQQVMNLIHDGLPKKSFTRPPTSILRGEHVPLPDVIGESVKGAMSILREAGFDAYVLKEIDSTEAKGTVLSTDPSRQAPKGSAVGLVISNGVAPPPPPPPPPPPTTVPPAPGGDGGGGQPGPKKPPPGWED